MVAKQLIQTVNHVQCSKCNATNRVGSLICESCGQPLMSGQMLNLSTQVMDPSSLPAMEQASGESRGNAFHNGMSLQLASTDDSTIVTLKPNYGRSIIMGRSDPIREHTPELDLTQFGGYARGISRSHASIVLINGRLQLMDMNSSNGTFVNEERIPARKPIELRNGDRIRLGGLEMRVNFVS